MIHVELPHHFEGLLYWVNPALVLQPLSSGQNHSVVLVRLRSSTYPQTVLAGAQLMILQTPWALVGQKQEQVPCRHRLFDLTVHRSRLDLTPASSVATKTSGAGLRPLP